MKHISISVICHTLADSSVSAWLPKVEVKRFFSFTYAFPALDHEWTGILAILTWLKTQLGNFQLDDDMVKEFEGHIAIAQQAELGAHGLPDNEVAQEQKLATLAELRKKTTNSLDLAAMIMKDRKVQIHGRMIHHFLLIGREAMAHDLARQHNQADSARYCADRVADGGLRICQQCAQALTDTGFLTSLAMTTQASFPESGPEPFFDEIETATQVTRLAMEAMAAHAWSMSIYAMTMPHSLAIGLHEQLCVARQGLQGQSARWAMILKVESMVFPSTGPGHDQTVAQGSLHALAQLLTDLDFHKLQIVRETCFSMSMASDDKGPWDPQHPQGEMQLWWMFGNVTNTKVFLEDTFRDQRQMAKVAGHTSSRFLRMQHVLTSGTRRCKEHTIPLVQLDNQDLGSVDVAKRTISQAVFAPPSNPEKAKHSLESGRPFDVGIPHPMPGGQVLEPMLDLSYLMESSVPETSKKGMSHRRSSRRMAPPADPAHQAQPTDMHRRKEADEAVSRAAGSAAKHRSSAAMAMIMALDGHQAMEWEGMVKNAWWGCLCGKGLLFKLIREPDSEPIVFMSLGFVGYAIIGWVLPYVPGQAYIRMADGGGQQLQWFFGHEVKNAHEFKGITIKQLVCEPQLHHVFHCV
jgi:hypothetical protein